MHLAFLIDPLEKLKPKKDSSLDLMVAAALRKHRVSILGYRDLFLKNGEGFALATEVVVPPQVLESSNAASVLKPVGVAERVPLSRFDVLFVRKDPPFDSQYLSMTFLLDQASKQTRIVNSPRGLREVSEKLYTTRYREHVPRTLVTWNLEDAHRFARRYDRVVLKAPYYGSGTGIFLSSEKDPNFSTCFETILDLEPRGPVLVQEYLPEGIRGDTRVMLLDGVPVAALGRRPQEGEFRANIAVGGEAFAVELSSAQQRIANEVGCDLRALGIVFAGMDFIGDYLIEINVTSPTLIQELRRVSGFDMSARILDFLGA